MAQSKLRYIFDTDGQHDEFISFRVSKVGDPSTFLDAIETFKDTGRTFNRFLPTYPGESNGLTSAADYKKYVELDYGGAVIFTVLKVDDYTVDIIVFEDEWEFINLSNYAGVTAIVSNTTTQPQGLSFVEDLFQVATDVCGQMRISLETNTVAPIIRLNGIEIDDSNAANPILLDVNRGIPIFIELENGIGEILKYPNVALKTTTYNFLQFSLLSNDDIKVVIDKSFNGATVTINHPLNGRNPIATGYPTNVTQTVDLDLEYSIDNINWFTTNTFGGQAVGNYIAYVRDQYGCVKQKAYEVTELGTRNPYLFISKANAIDFIESVEHDNSTIFKNDENTLNMQSLANIKYCLPRLFQTSDTTRIQIKSNYETFIPTLRKLNAADVVLPIEKKSSNLNRFKSMDCIYYKYKEGLLGVYFDNGNTYDELDIVIPGGEYNLNGNLPDFAIIGEYIEIDGLGVFEIKDSVFDANIKKKAIIVEYTYNSTPVSSRVKSVYDLLPYEIYEFEVVWSTYGEGIYDLVLENTDTINGSAFHLSENISLLDNQEKTLHIRYFNNNNRDIFYKYGIEHNLRVPFSTIKIGMDNESEISKGDLSSSLVTSSIYETNEFRFTDIDNNLARKLVIALSCESVFINNVGYVKKDSIEIENIENTNLNEITAGMIKTNVNYNNNRQGQEGVDLGYIDFNIPAFIDADGKFIKV